jgi:aldehyde:ferredoxin oxidoreductase
MGGYAGKILRIDLSTDKVFTVNIESFPIHDYIGGKGLGAYILYNELGANIDPLSPENVLMFLTGPLNGICPSTKMCVVGKSPLTGTFDDSYVGGHIASELKYAGYDGVIIKGRKDEPVYIRISDEDVEIEDGKHLWGLDTFETEKELIRKYAGSHIACIGPAGEKMVKFAHINTELYRQAGRGGLGAVMGSKNLKAIVVKGHGSIKVENPKEYMEMFRETVKKLLQSDMIYHRRRWGTPRVMLVASDQDLLPTRNFQEETFQEAENLAAEAMEKSFWVKHKACSTCPINCGKIGVLRRGPYAGTVLEGVEFESAGMLGSNCGIANLEAVIHANELCDKLGLDTISTGNVIGFIMECYERGILSEKDLEGIKANFGNEEALFTLIEKIANRQGIGNLLAEGVKKASEKIGKESQNFAIHVKGLEIPAWGMRSSPGMALAYATADRGGCHKRAWPIGGEFAGKGLKGEPIERYSAEGKAAIVKHQQDFNAATDCLVACDFAKGEVGIAGYMKMFNLAVGWDLSGEELMMVGERTWNLIRLFNLREGFTRKDDTIPVRMRRDPLPSGIAKGRLVSDEMLNKMLDDYYKLRGWDENGIPTDEKLKELGLLHFK